MTPEKRIEKIKLILKNTEPLTKKGKKIEQRISTLLDEQFFYFENTSRYSKRLDRKITKQALELAYIATELTKHCDQITAIVKNWTKSRHPSSRWLFWGKSAKIVIYICRHDKMFSARISFMLDVDRSRAFAKRIDVIEQGCWYNALEVFLLNKELQSGWYVEGWAISDKIRTPMEHGWLEQPDGSIIDPTWCVSGNEEIAYFSGEKYTFEQVIDRLADVNVTRMPFTGENRHTHPTYFQAYKDSLEASLTIAEI